MNGNWDWLLNGPLTIERILAFETALLLILLVLLRSWYLLRRRKRRIQEAAVQQALRAGVESRRRAREAARIQAPLVPQPAGKEPPTTVGVGEAPVAATVAPPALRPVPVRVRPKPAVDETVLSPETLMARAHEHLAAGAFEEAAVQFRLCVRLAAKLKQPGIEAGARLELGDLARASGDLTTACEHWQMARALFSDMKRAVDVEAAERRMERAGCPTDWVLTQF